MIRIALITFLLSCLFQTGFSQSAAKLRIHVVDSLGNGLPGVVVSLDKKPATATDSNGMAQLSALEGRRLLSFQYTGYRELTREVNVHSGEELVLEIELLEDIAIAGPVVVTAGRFEQKVSDLTVSMEVLKPKLFQDKNIVAIDEALQQTPGVAIVDDEPQIRSGSGYSFGAGSRVQVLVDDLPMLSGDAGKASWSFLPIENLTQVEVLKGASSVLYGSSALSGVINMRTSFPSQEPFNQVTIFHGYYSPPKSKGSRYWSSSPMRDGVFFIHKKKYGNLDFVFGLNAMGDNGNLGPIRDTATGNFKDRYNPLDVDRYNAQKRFRSNFNLRYHFKKCNRLTVGLNANWMLSESMATLIWANADTNLYGAFNGASTRTKQLLGTIDPYIEYRSRDGMSKQSIRNRWQKLDNNNDNNQGNFSQVYFSEYQCQQRWDSIGIPKLTTTFGLVNIYTISRGQLYTGGNANGTNYASNQAAYLQADQKVGERFKLSAGVRYEQFRINNAQQARPVFRAGVNYKLGKATYVRSSYGQGYRFPSIAEKFIITSLGAIKIFANPDLKPETSQNIEIGIKQGFRIQSFTGFLDIAAFEQTFKNFIEFTFGQWDPRPTLDNLLGLGFKSVNTGNARIRGFEISLAGEGDIGQVKIQTLMGYTYTVPVSTTPSYQYAKTPLKPGDFFYLSNQANPNYISTSSDPSNNILKYRMQHLIRADIGASWKKWSAGASFRYNSHMQNIDVAFETLEKNFTALFNPGINSWRAKHKKGDYVFDLRFAYTINAHHRVSAVVSNVLNREYAIRPLAIEEGRISSLQYIFTF